MYDLLEQNCKKCQGISQKFCFKLLKSGIFKKKWKNRSKHDTLFSGRYRWVISRNRKRPMIRFKCPNCDTVLQVSREYAGQAVLCSACNTQLIVPQTPVPEPTLSKAEPNQIICICGHCKSTYKVPASAAGRQVPCPKCGHTSQIPEDEHVITDSSTMRFTCPTCRQSYCVLAKYAGKKFDCLACRRPCMIPQARRPAEDLLMLEPDDTPEEAAPPSPPVKEAAADRGLSFKLQVDEESEESAGAEADELSLVPSPPETTAAVPPPRPAGPARPTQQPKKPKEKSSGSAVKIFAGIAAGLIGFIVGFLVVYNLVKPDDSGTETAPAPAVRQMEIAQTPEAIEFAESVIRRLNQNAANIGELKYEFPDHVYVTDSMIQSLAAAMNIGPLTAVSSVVEASRREIGASHYIVRTVVNSSTGQTREVLIGFFDIMEVNEDTFESETFNWIFSITITDENGTVLARGGPQDTEMLIAQMDELVDQHGEGMTLEEFEHLPEAIGTFFFSYVVGLLIAVVIILIAMGVVFTKAGEPGWAVIVPIYNLIVLARVGEKPAWMGLLCALSPLIPFVGGFVCLFLMISISIGVAETFGKGVLFGLGLWLLPIIFYPILAFSGSAVTD